MGRKGRGTVFVEETRESKLAGTSISRRNPGDGPEVMCGETPWLWKENQLSVECLRRR
jgi:hypothetical protein